MISLPGYIIRDKIYESRYSVVYRGERESDRRSVIIKLLNCEYPTIQEIARFRQEYLIANQLKIDGVVKAYSLEKYYNTFALILEDFGGQSLASFVSGRILTLVEFLEISIALAEILEKLYELHIIHKDIKPSNIIINPITRQVKLTDFSLASRLDLEDTTIVNSNLLEGTLAYISPEQTGRMNRSLDYRSDFYSLGVTYYEMLTGELPFSTKDSMEMVYCHIARKPLAPAQKKDIPQIFSDIVMKLLAKNAEDRYQSAAGLKYDLKKCRSQLEANGKVENFILATRDRGNQLLISQKLYGREKEVQTLLEAFKRVSNGAKEMMLVSGYSGIGKTSIVREIDKQIVASRGYFISGKFDQFQRNIPYTALIHAFQRFIAQLLTENEDKIAVWREKILNEIEPNGKIIIDIIPEIELIIGPQPEVPELGGLAAENRFNLVFQQFVAVFCQIEHPLAIFLDDLQWADNASLRLIEHLITSHNSNFLLLIGAYRDNEVNSSHPLIQTVKKIQNKQAIVNNTIVNPLNSSYVNKIISDTLGDNTDKDKLDLLVDLIFNKTQGNPFFVSQLLKTLYAERLLSYQIETDSWHWNLPDIQAIGIIDYNIVELIARNINKLPPETHEVLQIASCIGNYFNLEVLAIVCEASKLIIAKNLWPALQAGFILPRSENYKIPLVFTETEPIPTQALHDLKVDYQFLHDRVQQAAYSLIPQSAKKLTHLKIGRLLFQQLTPEARKDNIFALVNQLNFGIDLLDIEAERDELATLNLFAGQKAKSANAYEAAVSYLQIGLDLLGSNSGLFHSKKCQNALKSITA